MKEVLKNPGLRFLVAGTSLMGFRLLLFALIENTKFIKYANPVSIVISTILAFFVHSRFTWQFRPGTTKEKVLGFGKSILLIALIKTWIFPHLEAIHQLECPFYIQVFWLLDVLNTYVPNTQNMNTNWITCKFLTAGTMDVIAAGIDYVIYEVIGFTKKRKSMLQLSN